MSTDVVLQEPRARARFPVAPGETVTAWALSAISESYFPGEPALAEDRVNYGFVNGFVDVGDLPCRIALWKDVAERTVSLETNWETKSINLPGFNRRLEFSDFWHRPTRLSRWCRTFLEPQVPGNYPFRLATCGGVHLWVDGVLAASFEPYTRNKEQQIEIVLPLQAGGSDVVLLSEDLAERDTNWYVELTLLGDQPVISAVSGSADPKLIEELMALARDVRPQAEFITASPLVLEFDQAAGEAVEISASVLPGVHMCDKQPLFSTRVELQAGSTTVALDGIDAMPDGYHALDLVFAAGETRVTRQIAFALLRKDKPFKFAGELRQRKQQALEFAARHGEQRVGRALAMLSRGSEAEGLCRAIIVNTLTAIDERRDCSDFIMVPLLWIFGAYRDRIPSDLVARMRKSILDYRYWVDEAGNDTMWFWSENHTLCFHVSQYVAGSLLGEERFTASGRSGEEQKALGEERLQKWFDSVENHGLAEWNSAAYYPIDLIGLLALQHWGEGAIAQRAARILDRLFKMIALHTLAGVPAGSMGRAYDKELRAGPLTELAPFASVAFGTGWLNDGVAALPMLCAGHYEPPEALAALVAPEPDSAVVAHYVQGYGTAARLALFKTASVQLSASVGSEPGMRGHQQHIMDIRFAAHPFARAWINHPGEDDPWGHQRPSYWAGNGVMPRVEQHEDVLLMLYDIPDTHRIGFTHSYAPVKVFDEWDIHDTWLILRSGRGYAALSPCGPIEAVQHGPGKGREFRAYGRKAGWAVLTGDLEERAQLDDIHSMLAETKAVFDADCMTLSLERPGEPLLVLDYAKGLFVNGELRVFSNPRIDPRFSTVRRR